MYKKSYWDSKMHPSSLVPLVLSIFNFSCQLWGVVTFERVISFCWNIYDNLISYIPFIWKRFVKIRDGSCPNLWKFGPFDMEWLTRKLSCSDSINLCVTYIWIHVSRTSNTINLWTRSISSNFSDSRFARILNYILTISRIATTADSVITIRFQHQTTRTNMDIYTTMLNQYLLTILSYYLSWTLSPGSTLFLKYIESPATKIAPAELSHYDAVPSVMKLLTCLVERRESWDFDWMQVGWG